jgi:phosphoribosylformylglycinamidine synthase
MLLLPGSSALSEFRRQRLLESIRKPVHAFYVHVVQGKHYPELDMLLRYGTTEANQIPEEFKGALGNLKNVPAGYQMLFVFPRPGTISPWSSKATDIAKICGLTDVTRIERGTVYFFKSDAAITTVQAEAIHDKMMHIVYNHIPSEDILFPQTVARPLKSVNLVASNTPREVLQRANKEWGLALTDDEMDFLVNAFLKTPSEQPRNPTDCELMMFAQVNSEHCRHKIFGATWTIDGKEYESSLFSMIKNTYKLHPEHIISAYSDNAAVLNGPKCLRFAWDNASKSYNVSPEEIHTVIKVETHNHPTAISPFPGASTGSGGIY